MPSEILICKECKQNIKFEEAGNRTGFDFKLVVTYRCNHKDISSGPFFINNGYEINQSRLYCGWF